MSLPIGTKVTHRHVRSLRGAVVLRPETTPPDTLVQIADAAVLTSDLVYVLWEQDTAAGIEGVNGYLPEVIVARSIVEVIAELNT